MPERTFTAVQWDDLDAYLDADEDFQDNVRGAVAGADYWGQPLTFDVPDACLEELDAGAREEGFTD